MQLNREDHPVGLEFLGFRATYQELRARSDREHYATADDSQSAGIPSGRRSETGTLVSYRILQYSPSGEYVRLGDLSDLNRPVRPRSVTADVHEFPVSDDDGEHYGFWRRAERYEVLERLNVQHAQ